MSEDSKTLKLVHVIFRHGNRTNTELTRYPNDPHSDEQFFPYGRGQLTKIGKQNSFNMGKSLKKRYENYLGEYNFQTVEAFSTDMPRTKVSLQMVLAGLFPPSECEAIENLNWQPIPYHYKTIPTDDLLFCVLQPGHQEEMEKIKNSKKTKLIFEENKEIIDYISEHAGLKYTELYDFFALNATLYSEEECGLKLDEWTKRIYPEFVGKMAIEFLLSLSESKEMLKLGHGNLLKKIIDDSNLKIEGKLPDNRKIFLYSGHDVNVSQFLGILEIFEPHIPPYCAHIILELHEINGVNGFKIFYQDFKQVEPKIMNLPGCDEFCPLERFVEMYKKYLPEKQ